MNGTKITEKTLKLSKIKPYNHNPRDIRNAIEPLKESIRRFGFHIPIVVDSDYVIIAGHARYQALTELGHKEALVIISDMAPERAKEFRIIDNKAAEIAQWDKERLVAELKTIEEDMGVFFDQKELSALMGQFDAVSAKTPTDSQIKQAESAVATHFERNAQNLANRIETVKCQHCGQEFGFDRDIKPLDDRK